MTASSVIAMLPDNDTAQHYVFSSSVQRFNEERTAEPSRDAYLGWNRVGEALEIGGHDSMIWQERSVSMSRREDRPNILLIMADQMSAFATSPYGNRDALTPHMDALAQQGVIFQRAYCNSPLCVPSRASMMTGLLGSQIPVNDNGEALPASVPTFVHHLRRGGYQTILSGKMHFVGPDQLHGFEQRLTTDIYPSDFLWTPSWPRLHELVQRTERGEDALDRRDPNRSPAVACVKTSGPVPWTMQFTYDEEVQFRTLEWLRQSGATRSDDRPWFLCASFTHPHDPYLTTSAYWDRYDGRNITLPDEPPSDASVPHPTDTWANIHHGVNLIPPTRGDISRSRRGYYANTSFIDDKIGELIDELARLGLSENTVVLFTSDHGDQCGEHGMWFKRTCREWSARVPLIMAGPGIRAGHRVDTNASLVDLFPTLIEIAGLALPAEYDTFAPRPAGKSLVPLLRGEAPAGWRDEVTVEYNGDGTFKPIRVLVKGKHKFSMTYEEPDQLYDLERDPNEWYNVADDPAYADVATELREQLLREWNPAETEHQVLMSQRRRTFLNEALYQGTYTPWDYQPVFDAARMYSRRTMNRHWASLVYERVLIDSHNQTGLLDQRQEAES